MPGAPPRTVVIARRRFVGQRRRGREQRGRRPGSFAVFSMLLRRLNARRMSQHVLTRRRVYRARSEAPPP